MHAWCVKDSNHVFLAKIFESLIVFEIIGWVFDSGIVIYEHPTITRMLGFPKRCGPSESEFWSRS